MESACYCCKEQGSVRNIPTIEHRGQNLELSLAGYQYLGLYFDYDSKGNIDQKYLYDKASRAMFSLHTLIRLMFFDFSSAFNTTQPHLLPEKVLTMKISIPTVVWVLHCLTSRPQFVKASPDVMSKSIRANTGAPQGTVLSPFLFSLYTADCKNTH